MNVDLDPKHCPSHLLHGKYGTFLPGAGTAEDNGEDHGQAHQHHVHGVQPGILVAVVKQPAHQKQTKVGWVHMVRGYIPLWFLGNKHCRNLPIFPPSLLFKPFRLKFLHSISFLLLSHVFPLSPIIFSFPSAFLFFTLLSSFLYSFFLSLYINLSLFFLLPSLLLSLLFHLSLFSPIFLFFSLSSSLFFPLSLISPLSLFFLLSLFFHPYLFLTLSLFFPPIPLSLSITLFTSYPSLSSLHLTVYLT